MFYVKSVDRAKKTAKALRAAIIEAAGIEIPYFSCLDALARMYGFDDFKKLTTAAGSNPASPDDDAVEDAVALARRQTQIDVLIDLGLPVSAVEDVLDIVRPTGGSGPHSLLPRESFDSVEALEMIDRLHLDYSRLLVRRRLLSRPAPKSADAVPDLEGRDFFDTWNLTDEAALISAMLTLHDAGVGPRLLVAHIGESPLRHEARPLDVFGIEPERFTFLAGLISAMSKSVNADPAPTLESDALSALELLRDTMFTTIVETVSELPDRLVAAHLSSYLSGLAVAESCGVDLATLAYDSAFDLDPLLGFDLDEWTDSFGPSPRKVVPRDASPKVVDGFMLGALADYRSNGCVPMLWSGPIDLHILYTGVVRADGSLALPIDLLAAAGASGLGLTDLTAALNALASNRPSGIDPDLLAVAQGISRGDYDDHDVALFLSLMAKSGVGLADLCAHAFYYDVVIPFDDDEEGDGNDEDEDEGDYRYDEDGVIGLYGAPDGEKDDEITIYGTAEFEPEDGSKVEAPQGERRTIPVTFEGFGDLDGETFEAHIIEEETSVQHELKDDSDVFFRLENGSVFDVLEIGEETLSSGRNLLRHALSDLDEYLEEFQAICLDAPTIIPDVRREVLELVEREDFVNGREIHQATLALDGVLRTGAGAARRDGMALIAGVALWIGRTKYLQSENDSGFPLTALILLSLLEFIESSSTPEALAAASVADLAVLHVASNALSDIVDLLSEKDGLLEWVIGIGDWRKVYDADGRAYPFEAADDINA